MRLHNDTNLAMEASHEFKERQFSIKASPAAFQILSSGLYQDKIAAVIRELSTNAYDAHIAAELAGIPNQSKLPFDITLPTALNPVFKVRDYGTGLAEDQVFELYTTYFGSTKQDSDDFIGALGLGSKSPFSLVSSFLVVSFYNQIKTVYSAVIGEDGFPSIVKMHEELTSEPNGMEISVTVSSQDINNFFNRALDIYKYFNVKPNFVGGSRPTINEVAYERKGTNWGMTKHRSYNSSEAGAIQGQIRYSISLDALAGKIDSTALEFLSEVKEQFEFHFNIGDVEIQASREALSYTKRTYEAIERVLTQAMDELEKDIIAKIDSAASFIDAITIVSLARFYERAIVNRLLQSGYKWKSYALTTSPKLEVKHKSPRIDVAPRKSGKGLLLVDVPGYSKFNDYKTPARIYTGSGDMVNASRSDVSTFDYDPKFPNDTTKAKSRETTITYSIRQSIVGGLKIVYNDAGLPIYRLREHIRGDIKMMHSDTIWIVDKGATDFLELLKKATGISTHQSTTDWNVGEAERTALKKSCRTFTPKMLDYNNRYGITSFFVTSCIHDVADITALAKTYRYYICTSGNAFSFTNPFYRSHHKVRKQSTRPYLKGTELNELLQSLIETKFLNANESIVLVSAANEAILNELYPNIKRLDAAVDNVTWDKATPEQRVAIANALTYNTEEKSVTLDYYNGIGPIMNFLSMIKTYSKFPAFVSWATKKLDAYGKAYVEMKVVGNVSDRSNLKHIVPVLEERFGKSSKNHIAHITVLSDVEKEVHNNFKLFKLVKQQLCTYENRPHPMKVENQKVLVEYFDHDWKSYSVQPEVVKLLSPTA